MPKCALLPADRPTSGTPPSGTPPSGSLAVDAIAWRLYLRHRDASDALLEALAAADWARAAKGRLPLAGPRDRPRGAAWARCRHVAERAVAGRLRGLPVGAERYHRASSRPVWAAGLAHIAEVDGFLFFRPQE